MQADVYPSHLSRSWKLASGEVVVLRPVRHDDGEREEAFVRGLSRESGYQRMLTGSHKITPQWIDQMTHIDYHGHMAFVVTATTEGVEQFLGVGRYVVVPEKSTAEFALVVADARQRQGLGRRLLQALLDHAKAAGLDGIEGIVLATNKPMLSLALSLGFTAAADPGDATIARLRRELDD